MNRVVRQIEIAKRKMETWPGYLRREKRCSQWADIAGAHGAEKDEWKHIATHLRDWVKHQHGIGTAVGMGEVNEICLEAEYTHQFPEMKKWFEEE